MKKMLFFTIALIAMMTVAAPVKAEEIQSPSLALVNQENTIRSKAGIGPLIYSTELQAYADLRAKEASQVWSHTRPDGTQFNSGCRKSSGENLAYFEGDDDVISMWMASPSHKDNIMYTPFVYTAIGTYTDANGTTYVAQEFAYALVATK